MDYDKLLHIETSEIQKIFYKSLHYHRYEPTTYDGLMQLFEVYPLSEEDCLVDFGCGKGRLPILVHHLFGSTVVGVEMFKKFYQEALLNKEGYLDNRKNNGEKIKFEHCLAENYQVKKQDNKFYFFNPFSVQIFMKVVNNILQSNEEYPRQMEIILYYPSDEYIFYLDDQTPFVWKEEVRVQELYEKDDKERFLIYQLI